MSCEYEQIHIFQARSVCHLAAILMESYLQFSFSVQQERVASVVGTNI